MRQCNLFPETSNPMNDSLKHVNELDNIFKYCMSDSDEDHEHVKKAIGYMRTSEIDDNKELSGWLW